MMTIESLLERIANSCERQERLIEQLLNQSDNQIELLEEVRGTVETIQEEVPHVVIPTPAPTVPTPAPTVPTPAPTVPAPAPAATPAAFADQKAFMDYCMAKYKALGPIKGGMIQQILIELGASSIMGLPAEKWAEFRAKVEML